MIIDHQKSIQNKHFICPRGALEGRYNQHGITTQENTVFTPNIKWTRHNFTLFPKYYWNEVQRVWYQYRRSEQQLATGVTRYCRCQIVPYTS